MPLKLNVGLSRKISQDYNSRGFSLNLESELPANAVEDPEGLAGSVNQLFQLVGDLLDEQIRLATEGDGGSSVAAQAKSPALRKWSPRPPSQSEGANAGGNRQGSGNGRRGVTSAQSRAIKNMAKRLGYDPAVVAEEQFNVSLENLTIKQASSLIDLFKDEIETTQAEPASSS